MKQTNSNPAKPPWSVFLPKTNFPMRAGLPKLEPRLLQRWQENDLWQQIRAKSRGRRTYILHDGPPYANGHIHLGTCLNKIVKDIINRNQQMLGYDANYIPGWDCHGLPIEWKVEEKYRSANNDKDSVPTLEFRLECREFAKYWMGIQKQEFIRLGVLGDWQHAYQTMDFAAQAKIAENLSQLVLNGSLYRGFRPVLWSIVERTALAEAEVEYHQHQSTALYTTFPLQASDDDRFTDAEVVIWTTTPWTVPVNRMLAVLPTLEYVNIAISEFDAAGAPPGLLPKRLIVANSLLDDFTRRLGIKKFQIIAKFSGSDLVGKTCSHPFATSLSGYDFAVPILAADFVSSEQGTGIVHTAPPHGPDDFILAQRHKIKTEFTLEDDGTFTTAVPHFTGLAIYDSNGKPGPVNAKVVDELTKAGRLLSSYKYRHDYPYSWRSRTPLIYRLTKQWFIALDDDNRIRQKALTALAQVNFLPEAGRKRLFSMVEHRPDWCISRQRRWGVPLPVIIDCNNDEVLRDQAIQQQIISTINKYGADAWYSTPVEDFLQANPRIANSGKKFQKVNDVVDVWFDSGSTHSFVLQKNPALSWPADLYLEGSDQHRGWFQSSLLQSIATTGQAPYRNVMTHGFVLDDKGRKMSKSLGNTIDLDALIVKYGAEIVRLWIASSDFYRDIRFSYTNMQQHVDSYRRFRNTLRWLLGVLHDQPIQQIRPDRIKQPQQLDKLEQYLLHRLTEIAEKAKACAARHQLKNMMRTLFEFCNSDLSAFYFDIRKDLTYCGAQSDQRRQDALAVMAIIFDHLVRLLAPVLCFTADEAWTTLNGSAKDSSVHLQNFTATESTWHNPELAAEFQPLLAIRNLALRVLEQARTADAIHSSLEAGLVLYLPAASPLHDYPNLAEICCELCIVSSCEISTLAPPADALTYDELNLAINWHPAKGNKCQRCWQIKTTVNLELPLCSRCKSVMALSA